MVAVTYPNSKVIDFLQNKLIPLQLGSNAESYAGDYGVKWTPNLLVIDAEGKVYHCAIGFIPPLDFFIPWLLLGMGKASFGKDNFKDALEYFESVVTEYSFSGSAPEAIYFRGGLSIRARTSPMA